MTFARGVGISVVGVIVAAAVVTNCRSSAVAPSQANAARGREPVDGRVLFIGTV
jgi:hypothetical protein